MDIRLLLTTLLSALSTLLAALSCLLAALRRDPKLGVYALLGLMSLGFSVVYALILFDIIDSQAAGELYLRSAVPGLFFLIALAALLDAARRR